MGLERLTGLQSERVEAMMKEEREQGTRHTNLCRDLQSIAVLYIGLGALFPVPVLLSSLPPPASSTALQVFPSPSDHLESSGRGRGSHGSFASPAGARSTDGMTHQQRKTCRREIEDGMDREKKSI